MKILINIATTFLIYLSINFTPTSMKGQRVVNAQEILDSLHVSSKYASQCQAAGCLIASKNKAKSFKKPIVLFRDHNKWIVERNKKKADKMIDSYRGSKIITWYENVNVTNLNIKDEDAVIALY